MTEKEKQVIAEETYRLLGDPSSKFHQDKPPEWRNGYNAGFEQVSAAAGGEATSKRISLEFSLGRIEAQIKLLQQSLDGICDTFRWCETTLDIVNQAKIENDK